MIRIQLALIVIGGMLAWFGFQEFRVSQGTTAEPTAVEMADIEAGTADTSNAHLKIGEHFPAFFELIYWGEENTNKIDYVYYPILSPTNPFVVELDKLFEQHPDGIPDELWPSMESFSVLVKSSRFKTTDDLPMTLDHIPSLQGLVINKISSLKSDELDLMRQSFPAFDEDKVLVIEEGRVPAGAGKKFGMMGGGLVLILLGIAWMVVGRGK